MGMVSVRLRDLFADLVAQQIGAFIGTVCLALALGLGAALCVWGLQ